MIFAIVIGLPAGVAAAAARGRWVDLAIRGVALLGLSTPPFFVGVAAVLLLSLYLPSFKILGAGWWLTDVQAHGPPNTTPQPGPTLAPNSSTGEDGQLQAVYIPQTIGGGHGHGHHGHKNHR
jgi:hypothetical protein